jgi:hypothetical protein
VNTVATPQASQSGEFYDPDPVSVTLTCSTSGATISYQVVDLGRGWNGANWLTYSSPFNVSVLPNKTLWAYATKSAMNDSAKVAWDYWYTREKENNN